MAALDYPAFDADNHYYEGSDAFSRHLDPALARRCVQWAEIDGRRHHIVAGRLSRAVTNPTFDPIAKAGALHGYFRGNPEGRSPIEYLRERAARVWRAYTRRSRQHHADGTARVHIFPRACGENRLEREG